MTTIEEIQKYLLDFAHQRDWAQFQSPKNLSMALAVEAAELLEHFQWLTEQESQQLPDEKQQQVAYELADIFMYTLLTAKRLDIDIIRATTEKMQINEMRYPADRVKGSPLKHNDQQ